MDNQFTERLKAWLETPDNAKDYAEGALMLLRLSGNLIMYRNISLNPKGKAEFITGKLKQYLNFRLQQMTHEEVAQMQQQVETIVKETVKPDEEFADFKAGKRADHDRLPEEIQVLYAENLDIVHRMREVHLQLRKLSLANATCPDSERYPFLKELIALDKRLRENWDRYDHFTETDRKEDSVEQVKVVAASKDAETEKVVPAPTADGDSSAADGGAAVAEAEVPVAEDAKPKSKRGRKSTKNASVTK